MNDKTKEDRALDALIVAALRHVGEDSEEEAETDLREAAQFLTDEDRAALDRLGPDFIDRVMSGEPPSSGGEVKMEDSEVEELELETAMSRGSEDDLPQDVREEMEQRIEQVEKDEADEDSIPGGKEPH